MNSANRFLITDGKYICIIRLFLSFNIIEQFGRGHHGTRTERINEGEMDRMAYLLSTALRTDPG